jgi:hypothetical protein
MNNYGNTFWSIYTVQQAFVLPKVSQSVVAKQILQECKLECLHYARQLVSVW